MAKWDDHGKDFLRLRAEGRSYAKIARMMPVSATTCKKWGLKWQVKIEELQAAHVATFLKDHLMELERRLELRAEQISRLRDALADRDLEDLSTEQLLRLELRYLESVRRDVAPVRIEVANPLAGYERILVQCLHVEGDVGAEDVAELAEKWAAGPSAEGMALRAGAARKLTEEEE